MARDVVDSSFANDMLPVWLEAAASAHNRRATTSSNMVTDFLVAAFEAPGMNPG